MIHAMNLLKDIYRIYIYTNHHLFIYTTWCRKIPTHIDKENPIYPGGGGAEMLTLDGNK
jgi:hypothetical protein